MKQTILLSAPMALCAVLLSGCMAPAKSNMKVPAWEIPVSAIMLPFDGIVRTITLRDEAKAKKVGLWRGQFVAPWDWRRGKRLASEVQKTCCQRCRKGKACGNSCIKRTYTCQKQPGCACDAN